MDHPDAGSVRLDGHDLRDLRLADVRRNAVAVEQETFLFHATLAENVRYVKPDASDREVRDAILAAALGPLVETMPDGIETVVGESGRALSVGERMMPARPPS